MTEFDAQGFSAVKSFFGNDNDASEVHDTTSQPALTTKSRKNKRGGVGSTTSKLSLKNEALTESLLKVGRKRGRTEEDGDEEMGVEVGDEEELGRTTIVQETDEPQEEILQKPEPKTSSKKLGKKERQRLKAQSGEVKPSPEVTEESEQVEPLKEEDEALDVSDKPKKIKRRKIRSKQKNIRKDNRETKPTHLHVGKRHYQGRPLTAETRAKLNLPPPKVRAPFIPESKPTVLDADEGGLGIDKLLEDPGLVVQPPSKRKSSSKKKKKYKNL
eukprot:Nitzschia sp. Nitz4//scaffold3_size479765//159410//160225//NITZ4_000066-RA/size479765-processed-gene-0.102-mRNA-1//-1//CDS//3329550656//803//frame0